MIFPMLFLPYCLSKWNIFLYVFDTTWGFQKERSLGLLSSLTISRHGTEESSFIRTKYLIMSHIHCFSFLSHKTHLLFSTSSQTTRYAFYLLPLVTFILFSDYEKIYLCIFPSSIKFSLLILVHPSVYIFYLPLSSNILDVVMDHQQTLTYYLLRIRHYGRCRGFRDN